LFGLFVSSVSRFQYPESRKDLIKLEKGACSYMNRSIMSKGAFAVLYGQRLKFYITDPEVVLSIIFEPSFLSSKYDTPKIKKLHDILDLDCPNFLSFNLQIDKYVENISIGHMIKVSLELL